MQAPTQVQWHDAELTVKWHLTDRLLSPMRTYFVLVIYYLNHTDHPPNAPFLHSVSTQKATRIVLAGNDARLFSALE